MLPGFAGGGLLGSVLGGDDEYPRQESCYIFNSMLHNHHEGRMPIFFSIGGLPA